MTLAEILNLAMWPEIEACLRRHYCKDGKEGDDCDTFVSDHSQVYATLLELHPEADDTVVHIDIKEDEDGFEDFDVYGIKPGAKDALALELTRWELWLGMEVARSTLQRFSSSEIVAHCLYEMSFCGYDQEEIAHFTTEVRSRAEKAHGDEFEGINAEDIFWEEYGDDPERLAEINRKVAADVRRLNSDRSAGQTSDPGDKHG